ncbi:MAG: methyltransferase domain-containing protein [bacterium]
MKKSTNSPLWDAKPDHAETYDKYAVPQQQTADELIEFINDISPQKILEPGSGTGYYTKLLVNKFPTSQITCVDLSATALQAAKRLLPFNNITFTRGDIEKMPLINYDLITANAVFQWIRDFPGWMNKVYDSLIPYGVTAFSYFGGSTYRELAFAVKSVFGEEEQITSSQFHTIDEIRNITSKFSASIIKTTDYTIEFASLRDLLLSIRATGTRGRKVNAPIWTKGKYNLIEKIYNDEFGGIKVTYNVILYRGVK